MTPEQAKAHFDAMPEPLRTLAQGGRATFSLPCANRQSFRYRLSQWRPFGLLMKVAPNAEANRRKSG